ncbi:MAG: hypothetical protein IIU89_04505 [Bacteroidales bacterium]|jgi:hypothetical protein|nr:hypothetical protein [Bacteroidales bacterium]
MKNKAYRLISIAIMVLILGSCAKVKQVGVTSFELDSITPKGLRALTVKMSVGVHNPANEITLSEISGEAVVSGKVIGNVAMAPVVLTARKDSTYKVKADVTLAEGVSVLEVLALAKNKSAIENGTANIYAKAKLKGGPSKKIKMEDVPLKKLKELLK